MRVTKHRVAAIALTLGLALAGCSTVDAPEEEPDTSAEAVEQEPEEDAAPAAEVVEEEAEPAAELTDEEPVEPAEEDSQEDLEFTAEDVEQYLLEIFGGAANFQSIELDPVDWPNYVVNVEVPNSGLVRVTLQTSGDDPIVEGSSMAIFSLIGNEFESVQWVEVVDGAGVHIEQTHRRDVPLLN